jgi:hypothetical protein
MKLTVEENDAVALVFGDVTIEVTMKRSNPRPAVAVKAVEPGRKKAAPTRRSRHSGKSEAEKLSMSDRKNTGAVLAW